jgi:uncharacterized protein YndB with AHSA1/START domain
MPTVDRTITIDAPPEAVFDLLTDPNRAAEWSGAVRSGSGPHPTAVGETFEVEAAFLGATLTSTSDVVEHDRPTRYAYAATQPVALRMAADLAEAGGGTALTVTVDLDPGRLFAAAGPLLKRQMRKQLEGDLAQLKALLEG